MSISLCGLLFVLFIGINAETCKYEFVVPAENCRPNPVMEDEPRSIMHIQTSVDTTNERLNAMAQTFMQQLTKLDGESKNMQELTAALESKLDATNSKFETLNNLMEEVQSLKTKMTDATEKLNPKFSELQNKLIDIASKFQSQSTSASSMVSSIQRQLAETVTTIGQHSRDIEKLRKTAETVEGLIKRSPLPQMKESGLQAFETRLEAIEEALDKGSSSPNVINSLKSAMNIMQSELMSSVKEHRQQFMNLNGMITSLQSAMEVLRRSVGQ